MNWKQVTREEFEAFVRDYGKPLTYDVCQIPEPPLLSYNDFSWGKVWPESMVAKIVADWLGPNGEHDLSDSLASPGKFWRYFIRVREPGFWGRLWRR